MSSPTATRALKSSRVFMPSVPKPATAMAKIQPRQLDPSALAPEVEVISERLAAKVLGQASSLEELVKCYTRFRAGLAPENKPVGFFLLVGPTGSGKSHTAIKFAQEITGKKNAPLRIDCAEYVAEHEVSKLLGAPPGYLGHKETKTAITNVGLSAQHSEDQQLSVLLFDEIDKAHPRLLDLLLGIADAGKLKLGDNSEVDFTRTIILLTANSGAREMQEALAPKWGLGGTTLATSEKAGSAGERAAKRTLRPELFNRLDKILVFQQLTEAQIAGVLDLELNALEGRLLRTNSIGLSVSAEAREFLAKEGYDARYGARHLKRAIERHLAIPIANMIVAGQINSMECVRVGRAKDPDKTLTYEAFPVPPLGD